jgi:hypothetical protein
MFQMISLIWRKTACGITTHMTDSQISSRGSFRLGTKEKYIRLSGQRLLPVQSRAAVTLDGRFLTHHRDDLIVSDGKNRVLTPLIDRLYLSET